MTERPAPDGAPLVLRVGAPLALLALVAGAILVPSDLGLSLADPDRGAPDELTALLDTLPDEALVLVGFDPDLGTYAEIRPTVRTLLGDLIARNARLAFVSLTPEGRAIALAEIARLRHLEANPRQVSDLGFVPGAEAALVAVARGLTGAESVASPASSGADGTALADARLALVVGGNDLGPRSWVEQVAVRVPQLPIAAVTPTPLMPEVMPYLESGQLDALIATPRQGATYREAADLGALARFAETAGPAPLAIGVGLLAAIAYLAAGLGAPAAAVLRGLRRRDLP